MHAPVHLKKFWLALIPATFAAISLILVVVSITAGHCPGVMEDYHVLYFNTSTLGKSLLNDSISLEVRSKAVMPLVTEEPNLLHRYHAPREKRLVFDDPPSEAGNAADALAAAGDEAAAGAASAANATQSGLEHLVNEAQGAMEEIEDNLADELYKRTGVHQFYSVHLTNMCHGNFTPNATTPGAGFGVVKCTQPLKWAHVRNLTSMLNHSLRVGPFQLDLADIGMAQDAVAAVDQIVATLTACLTAMLAMYILAAFFAFLNMALSVWAVFALTWTDQPGTHKTVSGRTKSVALYSNLATACLATTFLFVANMVTTLGGKYAVDEVHARGAGFGLETVRGGKFLAVTWAAFALATVAASLWLFQCAFCFLERRERASRRLAEPVAEPKLVRWDEASSIRSFRSIGGSRMMEHL